MADQHERENPGTTVSTTTGTEPPPGRVPGQPELGVAQRPKPLQRLAGSYVGEVVAEFIGTFMLLVLGDGSVAVTVVGLPGSGRRTLPFGAADWLIISWGWGLAVVFAVYLVAGISGAHINPAVTLAMALRRGFPWHKVPGYWFGQLAGAFTGAALVYAVYYPAINEFNVMNQSPRPESLNTFAIFATFPASYFHGSWTGPFIDQVVGTAILLMLIAALLDTGNMAPQSNLAPFLIGLVVVAIGMTYGTNAGYAINPARDFGPRLFAYALGWGGIALPGSYQWFANYWWVPIAGPLAGGVIGILLYDVFAGAAVRARASRA